MTSAADSPPRGARRALKPSTEAALNVAAIVAVPLLARLLADRFVGPLRGLGFRNIADLLSGVPFYSDIGVEVASAFALFSRSHSAYEPATVLAPLIGMDGSYQPFPHTHPPTSTVLWLPLAAFDYNWWLPFFAMVSISAIALTLRLLDVPAWLAYPFAIGIAVSPVWTYGLVSTYPLTAFAIAAAWTFRNRPIGAGIAYGLLTAARGFAGLLLLYPLVRRQWRTLAVSAAILVVLLAVAVALEPDVVHGFLTSGLSAANEFVKFPSMYSLEAVATRRGLPSWTGYAVVAAIAALALARRNDLFWVLVWVSVVAAPVAWVYSTIALLPLAVMTFRAGIGGRVCMLLGLALIVGPLPGAVVGTNFIWIIGFAATAIGLLVSPIRADRYAWPNRALLIAERA